MKGKILSRDYKEELANIAEEKGFNHEAENLLLSMAYKIEDSYNNYQTVKREVPSKNEFLQQITEDVLKNCDDILIAEPKTKLDAELKKNKCRIMTEKDAETEKKKVISYPNEKNLLYGIKKVSLQPMSDNLTTEEEAIITTINIGKCISQSEVIRDFNGWSWSILENEIESSECNIVYIFLSYLLGHEFLNCLNLDKLKVNVTQEFYSELTKVAIQFYMSYDKKQNELILKRLSEYKRRLEKMKNQANYVIDIAAQKKKKLAEIKEIDKLISNPKRMREEYLKYNSTLPDERKIFSIRHYEEKLQNTRNKILDEINTYNKMQNPVEFIKEKEKLQYEIKLYEGKTDIAKLQKEFLKCYERKLERATEKKKILDMLYEIRYLNFLPNCKMNLNSLKEKVIIKAIKYNIIAPISNNDILDYRILKGLFDSQIVNLENLSIKLSSNENRINVELYDGDMLEASYDVVLPEGSSIEIIRSKRMKIFE